jgi:hypothetical protein
MKVDCLTLSEVQDGDHPGWGMWCGEGTSVSSSEMQLRPPGPGGTLLDWAARSVPGLPARGAAEMGESASRPGHSTWWCATSRPVCGHRDHAEPQLAVPVMGGAHHR